MSQKSCYVKYVHPIARNTIECYTQVLKIPGHKPVCDPHSCVVVGLAYWIVVCVILHAK